MEQSNIQQMHKMFLDFLLTVPVLCSLDLEAQNDFLERCELKNFAPGELVIAQGDPPAEFFLVLSGHAIVYQSQTGESHLRQPPSRFSSLTDFTRLRSLGRGGTAVLSSLCNVLKSPRAVLS
jgi:CRP-like cAMP-binding protein